MEGDTRPAKGKQTSIVLLHITPSTTIFLDDMTAFTLGGVRPAKAKKRAHFKAIAAPAPAHPRFRGEQAIFQVRHLRTATPTIKIFVQLGQEQSSRPENPSFAVVSIVA